MIPEARAGGGGGSVPDEGRRSRVRRVIQVVLFLNVLAVSVKLLVWWWTGALSILAEAAHSGVDALNNVVALLFARVALRGPDEDHPYGHHKFEPIGALFVVGLLSITVYELVKGAGQRLLSGPADVIETPWTAFVVLGTAALFGWSVAAWEAREGRKLGSHLLLADAAHTRADALGTVAVLGGLMLVRAGHPVADPLLTLAISGLIGWTGWGILRSSIPVLVDERGIEAGRIRTEVDEVDGVLRSYAIRSRGGAGAVFVELTIAVDPVLDVARSHEIADAVERRIRSLGARQVVVHVEPG